MPLVYFPKNMPVLGWWALGFSIASTVVFILSQGRPYFTNASQPSVKLPPAVAIQFVRDRDDVDAILSEPPSPDREAMRFKQYLDFVFIPLYAAAFVTIGLLLMGNGWSRYLGMAGIGCAIAAGLFDFREDFAILAILNLRVKDTPQAAIDAIRHASIPKWALLSVSGICLIVNAIRRFRKK